MKVIYNKFIPFKGFKAINLFGIIFARKECTLTKRDLNHEAIHTAQMKDFFYIPFYILYFLCWICNLIRYWSFDKAYKNIIFEKEAYSNEGCDDYLKHRWKFDLIFYL